MSSNIAAHHYWLPHCQTHYRSKIQSAYRPFGTLQLSLEASQLDDPSAYRRMRRYPANRFSASNLVLSVGKKRLGTALKYSHRVRGPRPAPDEIRRVSADRTDREHNEGCTGEG